MFLSASNSQIRLPLHLEFILSNNYGKEMNNKMTAPGVLEVEVKEKLTTSTYAVWQAAVDEAGKILGCQMTPWEKYPGCGFDFIVILLADCKPNPNEDCGYAAYAYIGLGISVFVKDYGSIPSVVSHELGHNVE